MLYFQKKDTRGRKTKEIIHKAKPHELEKRLTVRSTRTEANYETKYMRNDYTAREWEEGQKGSEEANCLTRTY